MSNNGGHLTVQYNLRWSEELRDKIADAAKENTRSMNQEIIARLEESFEQKHVQEFFRITKFDDLEEPAASIEIGAITIGLFESQYKEIELFQVGINSWVLSYHAVRCTLRDQNARQLLELGCTNVGLETRF